MDLQIIPHYFPGGNTPRGFVSYYHQILDQTSVGHLAVIKGGPGTGKSTFMKRLGEKLEQQGEPVTYLHCSSDPDSLDGLFVKKHNSAIIDGTAPHVTDPRYPGGTDILLNFCDFIREEELKKHPKALQQLNQEISYCFRDGYCYLESAAAIAKLMHQRSAACLIPEEIQRFVAGFLKRLSGYEGEGTTKTGFLSAITPCGFRNYLNDAFAQRFVVMLQAEAGDATYEILQVLLEACKARHIAMEVFPCPMQPDLPEHILFPGANLAITVGNEFHAYDTPDEVVYFTDFCCGTCDNNREQEQYRRQLSAAMNEFSKAKLLHDRLEESYIPHTDFSRMESLQQRAMSFLTQN